MAVACLSLTRTQSRNLAAVLQVLVKAHGSQKAVAERLGIGHGTVSNLLKGHIGSRYPCVIDAVARAIGRSRDEVLGGFDMDLL